MPPLNHVSDQQWVIILGGYDSSFAVLQTIELLNWYTGQACSLHNLPVALSGASGAYFQGVPVYCGGVAVSGFVLDCFRYDKLTQNWIQVPLIFSQQLFLIFQLS